jgi:type I restriction enzyme S subunit
VVSQLARAPAIEYEPPIGWDVARLGDAVKESKRTLDPRDFPNELFEYYSIPAYQEGRVPIQERGSAIGSQKLLVEPGTVLFGKLNPRVPKVWRVSGSSSHRMIASTEFIPLDPVDGRIDGEFLYYLSWSDSVMGKARGLVSGSTPSRQRVDPQSFLALPILLPPLKEQQVIASVLRAVQQAMVETEKVIAATRELKRSLMSHLFTYGPASIDETDNVALKETEIGLIPRNWGVQRLGDLTSLIQYGTSERAIPDAEGVPVLGIPQVVRGRIELVNLRYLPRNARGLSKLSLYPGDLLFVRTNATRANIGSCSLYQGDPEEAVFASYLIRVRLKGDALLPEFVHAYTWSDTGQTFLSGRATGAADGKFNINSQTLRDVLVPVPPSEEQREIVRQVLAMNRKLAAEGSRKMALKALFDTTLSDLMSGHRRVASLEAVRG